MTSHRSILGPWARAAALLAAALAVALPQQAAAQSQVLKDMIGRSRELKLRAAGAERSLRIEFAILLTVKTMDFHYSRRNWFAL